MAISWPDRRLWISRVFRARATILDICNREPWVAAAGVVPLTLIALAGAIGYPYVFLPLLVLTAVALFAVEFYVDQETADADGAPAAAEHPEAIHGTQEKPGVFGSRHNVTLRTSSRLYMHGDPLRPTLWSDGQLERQPSRPPVRRNTVRHHLT
jgi:hypothetical protein